MITTQIMLEKEIGLECIGISGNNEFRFNCPFCIKKKGTKDVSGHLYINPNKVINNIKGWFFCHRCGSSGPLDKIKKTTDYTNNESTVSSDNWVKCLNRVKFGKNQAKMVYKKEKSKIELPEDYKPIIKCTEAYKYLKSRKITDEHIKDYNIGFGNKNLSKLEDDEDKFKFAGSGRIVFPDYDDSGNLKYWVARTYKNHYVKYKNPKDFNSRDQIYNLSMAKEFDRVIVTEGVISAIIAGRNAVATYGKNITQEQIAILSEANFKEYYIALDGDALSGKKSSVLSLAEELRLRNHDVWVIMLPYYDDPASVEDFSSFVKSAKRYGTKLYIDLVMN